MELVFSIHGDVIEAHPVKRSIESFFGCCKEKSKKTMTISEMDEAIEKAVSENCNHD